MKAAMTVIRNIPMMGFSCKKGKSISSSSVSQNCAETWARMRMKKMNNLDMVLM